MAAAALRGALDGDRGVRAPSAADDLAGLRLAFIARLAAHLTSPTPGVLGTIGGFAESWRSGSKWARWRLEHAFRWTSRFRFLFVAEVGGNGNGNRDWRAGFPRSAWRFATSIEGLNAALLFTDAEDLGAVNVQGGNVGLRRAAIVMLGESGRARSRRREASGGSWLALQYFFVRRNRELVFSKAPGLSPPRVRVKHRPASVAKAGSRGKTRRCCHGLIVEPAPGCLLADGGSNG